MLRRGAARLLGAGVDEALWSPFTARTLAVVRKIERGEATLADIPERKETRDYLITAPWMAKHPGVLAQLQGVSAPVAQDTAAEAEEPAAEIAA